MLPTGGRPIFKETLEPIFEVFDLFINNLRTRAKNQCVENYHRAPGQIC